MRAGAPELGSAPLPTPVDFLEPPPLRRLLAVLAIAVMPVGHAKEPDHASAVRAATEQLANATGMKSGILGVAVLPVKGGAIAYDHMGATSLVPASAMKAITTGAALHYLGPGYRFTTTLQSDTGGNLFIKGSGDPTFAEYSTGAIFDEFTAKLKEAGTTEIGGAVIGDATAFGTQLSPDTWQYYDIGNYFGAGASGLSLLRNSYRIYFAPGKSVGSPAKFLRCAPAIPGLKFTNEMRTGSASSGDRGFVYATPYTQHAFLRGTIPMGRSSFSIKGSMPDPALTCAQFFSAHLEENGIRTARPATTMRRLALEKKAPSAGRTDIFTHRSAPLSKIVQSTNFYSINLHAEALLNAIGQKTSGRGTSKLGAAANLRLVKSLGINTTGLHIADGSGLSRLNGVTPRQLTYILKAFHNGEHGTIYLASLPVAGKSGTLKYITGGTPAAGRIRAKSGTLERVKCYVGFADARSGKRYAFAIMVNNFTGDYYSIKKGIERIMTAIVGL